MDKYDRANLRIQIVLIKINLNYLYGVWAVYTTTTNNKMISSG
jgi:hypothetical protein